MHNVYKFSLGVCTSNQICNFNSKIPNCACTNVKKSNIKIKIAFACTSCLQNSKRFFSIKIQWTRKIIDILLLVRVKIKRNFLKFEKNFMQFWIQEFHDWIGILLIIQIKNAFSIYKIKRYLQINLLYFFNKY